MTNKWLIADQHDAHEDAGRRPVVVAELALGVDPAEVGEDVGEPGGENGVVLHLRVLLIKEPVGAVQARLVEHVRRTWKMTYTHSRLGGGQARAITRDTHLMRRILRALRRHPARARRALDAITHRPIDSVLLPTDVARPKPPQLLVVGPTATP